MFVTQARRLQALTACLELLDRDGLDQVPLPSHEGIDLIERRVDARAQRADDGIRVVGVNPGPVATDRMVKLMKRRAVDWWGDESRWQELFAMYPGGRPASAEEVADLMVFLASPRAGYITGTIVTIDGGIAAQGSII